MNNDVLQIIYELSAEQFDDMIKNGSITVDGITYTFSPSNLHLVPSSQLYRYHIKLTFTLTTDVVSNVEFDIYSQSATLFSTSNTYIVNWGIFQALYSGQTIPIAYTTSGTGYNRAGSVQMIVPNDSTSNVQFYGAVYDKDGVSTSYILDEGIIANDSSFTFEFTQIAQ